MMNRSIYIISALAALALTACSDHDAPDANPKDIRFGSTAVSLWQPSGVGARASTDVDAEIDAAGVYGYSDAAAQPVVFANQILYNPESPLCPIAAWPYQTGTWPYDPVQPWQKANYKFIVYAPYMDTGVSVSGNEYTSFNTITFDQVYDVSPSDIMVGGHQILYDNTRGTNEVQLITLKHLQSRLRFFYRLGPNYDRVRAIVIRSMKIASTGLNYTVTISHDANGVQQEPVWTSNLTGMATPVPMDVELVRDVAVPDTGLRLDTAEPRLYASAYVYNGTNNRYQGASITVTYDVYDKAGLRTRKDQTVTNNIHLGATTGGWELKRGYYYDVMITIEPSYLYVLSDNDPDVEGYLIIPDEP